MSTDARIQGRRSKASWLVAAVIALAVGAITVERAMDFPLYYHAAARALAGDPTLYDIDELATGIHFRYAPVFALIVAPLTVLPLPVATFVWFLLKVLALIATTIAGLRLMRTGAARVSGARVFLIAFILAGAYVLEEFMTGNAHFLAMSGLVGACYLVERGRVWPPAALLALAILTKVTPVFALVYFAVRRQWSVVGATVVVIVGLSLAPSFVAGHDTNMVWLRDWRTTVVDRLEARPDEHDNSLKGALTRYFPAPDASAPARPTAGRIIALPREATLGLWLGLCTVIAALVLQRAAARDRSPRRAAAEYGLLVTAIILMTPHSTRIYYSALFFPYVVLTIAALRPSSPREGRILRACLWVAFGMNTLVALLVPGRTASLGYEDLSPFVLSSLVVFALLHWLSRARE